jgi:hypothetical protein
MAKVQLVVNRSEPPRSKAFPLHVAAAPIVSAALVAIPHLAHYIAFGEWRRNPLASFVAVEGPEVLIEDAPVAKGTLDFHAFFGLVAIADVAIQVGSAWRFSDKDTPLALVRRVHRRLGYFAAPAWISVSAVGFAYRMISNRAAEAMPDPLERAVTEIIYANVGFASILNTVVALVAAKAYRAVDTHITCMVFAIWWALSSTMDELVMISIQAGFSCDIGGFGKIMAIAVTETATLAVVACAAAKYSGGYWLRVPALRVNLAFLAARVLLILWPSFAGMVIYTCPSATHCVRTGTAAPS